MRLYELAYSVRLYATFTDFDSSIKNFRDRTNQAFDLDNAAHRLELLKWLNSWGCRQFAKNYHNTASENLRKWGKPYLNRLPSRESELIQMDPSFFNVVAEAYGNLKEQQACIRGVKNVTFGSTGAAKIMFALRPKLFPPWDEPIRKCLGYDGSSESYLRFLMKVQAEINSLITDAVRCGVGPNDIPAALHRPTSSLAKLVDEHYWVIYTRKCSIPPVQEVEQWLRWATGEPDNRQSQK